MPESVPCNLCGSNDLEDLSDKTNFLGLKEPFRVVRCGECGLMFMSPRPTVGDYEQFYAEAGLYDLRTYVERSQRRQHLLAQTWDEIEKTSNTKRGKLLEIGCGPGVFLRIGKDRGWEVHGVEITEQFLTHAREELGLDVRKAQDLKQAGFEEGQFDVVYSSHVLEHVLDPLGMLAEANRILKRGGLLVTEVPNVFDNIIFLLFRPWKRRFLIQEELSLHHTHFFTMPTLRSMIETCGFETIRQTTYSRRLLRRLDSRIIGGRHLRELMFIIGGALNKGPMIEVYARKSNGR